MSSNTALTVVTSSEANYDAEDLEALKKTIAKGCDPSQFRVFCVAFTRLGLDPFARQIVPIVQGGQMTPQVTIDGFRLIADRTGKYLGQLGPFWCGDDGEWADKWLLDKAPTACKVGVIREGFREVMWGTARTKAYAKGGQWVTMPDVMIAKVAESIALRKAFPNELSGVYTGEEMAQALDDNEPYVDATAKAVQPAASPTPIRQTVSERKPTAKQPLGPTPEQIRVISGLCAELGIGLPADLTFQTAGKAIFELKKQLRERPEPADEYTFTVDESGEMHDPTTVEVTPLGA